MGCDVESLSLFKSIEHPSLRPVDVTRMVATQLYPPVKGSDLGLNGPQRLMWSYMPCCDYNRILSMASVLRHMLTCEVL